MSNWITSSCILILVVLALRSMLGKKLSARMRYAIWAVVLVRLLVPVSISMGVMVPKLPAWEPPEVLREKSIHVPPTGSLPADGAPVDPYSSGYPRLAEDGEGVARRTDRISPLELLKWIWVGGGTVLGALLLGFNLHFGLRLRRSRRWLEGAGGPVPVYVSGGLPSPCLFGLLRPAVYVTEGAAADPVMLRHVMAHELTHYRHLDHLWSVLRGAALAVHWWNPLVWLAAVYSRRDGELACDEGALCRLGDGERTAYGETLLALVTAKGRPRDLFSFATTMSGGKRSLAERIRRISCQPKQLVSAVAATVVVLGLTVFCTFGRASEESGAPGAWETEVLSCSPDLDRDGKPEALRVLHKMGEDPAEWRLEIFNRSEVGSLEKELWSVQLDESHGGCGTYFLCQEDGLDYLLSYMPKMQQGQCTYSYRLFHLEGGEEVTDREASVEFDINFSSPSHRFDPEEIADFMWEVNGLMGGSQLLLNTNNWMLSLEEDGRLRDNILVSLNHPDTWDFSSKDELLAGLMSYAGYAGDHPDSTRSPLEDLLAEIGAADIGDISGQDKVTAAELAALLREAAPNRTSRSHEYENFAQEWAWTWSTAEWAVPLAHGGTLYLLACDSGGTEIGYETADGCTTAFYDDTRALYDLICAAGEPYYREELPCNANLNRDRSPDKLTLRSDKPSGGSLWCLQWEDHGDIWRGEASTSHPGWKAFFLCRLDGEDYLLEYTPYIGMGMGSYRYRLFYLEEGMEVAVRENEVSFDMNFGMEGERDFDPRAIAAFMDELNGLLEHGTLLLCTDPDLAATFEEEGRLYDSLWWLDVDFERDVDKSLLENLLIYRNQALTEVAVPYAEKLLADITADDIQFMQGGSGISKTDIVRVLNSLSEKVTLSSEERDAGSHPHRYLVGYTRDDSQHHTICLEAGAAEGEVYLDFEGTVTVPFYSENPDNDAMYLRDVPYSITGIVDDTELWQLVTENG